MDPAVHDRGAARMSFLTERKREAFTRVQKCRADPKCSDVLLRDNEGFVACVDGRFDRIMYGEIQIMQCDTYRFESCNILYIILIYLGFVNELPCDGVDQMSFINLETLTGNDSAAYVMGLFCHNFGRLALLLQCNIFKTSERFLLKAYNQSQVLKKICILQINIYYQSIQTLCSDWAKGKSWHS